MSSLLRCLGLLREDDLSFRSNMDNLSLGINVSGGKMKVLIPPNTNIPIKVEKIFSVENYSSSVSIKVYEGESSLISQNFQLGMFDLSEILPAPNGVAMFKICFVINENGTLKVSAIDIISEELLKEITITSYPSTYQKKQNAKNALNKCVNKIERILEIAESKYKVKPNAEDKRVITAAIKLLNKNGSVKVCEYIDKRKELEALFKPLLTKLHKEAMGGPSPPPPPKEVEPKLCIPSFPKTTVKWDDVD